MKKQILTAMMTLIATSTVFATPVMMGEVRQKDELMIINNNISCSVYSSDATKISAETLVNGVYTSAVQIGNAFHISGDIDGEIFSVHANLDNGIISLSMQAKQELADVQAGKSSPYSFTSSGDFTKKHSVVSLTATINGRTKSVSCAKFEVQ